MLFAFGSSSDSFYIAHGRKVYWQGLPDSLVEYLKGEHRWLNSLSICENEAWFYKEMPSYRSSGSESGANFVQREEDRLRFVPTASPAWSTSYQRVKELYDSNEVINWVSFGPNGAYFVVTTESVYASDTSMMCNKKGKNTPIPPRCASFGYNESWVIVENDGEVRYHGLSTDIEVKLKSSPVQRVALSPHSAASYFIEFTDGNTEFSLPDSWGEHITKIKRTSVQLDMLWVSSDPLKKPNVLFAFGSVKDQFVMITEHKKHSGIDEELRLDSGKYIAALSLGEGGAVFRKIGTSPELLAAPDLRLKLEIERLEREIKALEGKIEPLQVERTRIEEKMLFMEKADRLREEIQQLEDRMKSWKSDRTWYQEQIRTNAKKRPELRSAAQLLGKGIKESEGRVKSLKVECARLEREISEYKPMQCQEEMRRLEDEMKPFEVERIQLRGELERWKVGIKGMEEERTRLEEEMCRLKKEMEELKEEMEQLLERKRELDKTIQQLEPKSGKDIKRSTGYRGGSRGGFKEKRGRLREKAEGLKERIKEMEEKITLSQRKMESLEDEVGLRLRFEQKLRLEEEVELSPAVELVYPAVWKLRKTDVPINWVAFGPHGYYICDTPKKVYAYPSSITPRTDERGRQIQLRCASFGYGGTWVVVERDGVVHSHGLTANVRKAMLQQEIRHIQLSPIGDEFYYIEYMDGTSDWSLPAPWHDEVRRMEGSTKNPPPFSSVNLKTLDDTTNEYSKVQVKFATSWNMGSVPPPRLHVIYKVQYIPTLDDPYKEYLKKVGNEEQFFHGTGRKCQIGDPTKDTRRRMHMKVPPPGEDATICYDSTCSLCEILRISFSVRFARDDGDFGSGIYSSSTSSKAAGFSRNSVDSGYSAMMLCNVAVGKAFITGEWTKGQKKAPKGYGSVIGVRGHRLSDDKIVVYDDDAIRPAYLIIYEAPRELNTV